MTDSDIEKSQITYARLAGFMYLFVNVAYVLALLIINHFTVPGDFAETAHRIIESELLYRLGLSSELVANVGTVFLAMGLYVAVKPIDNNLALLALLSRLVEATLFGVQTIFDFAGLQMYVGGADLKAFDATQLSILMEVRSVANGTGFNIAAIFFSVGSILFFYLFLKSAYIPRILSVVGLFASVLVPIVCFGSLIWPQHAGMLFFGWIPMAVAETAIGLWLLIRGVNVEQWEKRSVASAKTDINQAQEEE